MLRGGPTTAAIRRCLAASLLLVACAAPALADAPGAGASRVPRPTAATPGGACVEDTAFMRRNHMNLIRHQRDLTVREGIRTTKHSLANCVDCHADPKTGRVTGSRDAFCEGCHAYAAVKLDCFECHADRAKTAATASVEKAK
jgi:hypothetical protein